MKIDQILIGKVANQMRALEALSRISKVTYNQLFEDIAEVAKYLPIAYIPERNLEYSIDRFIKEAAKFHEDLTRNAKNYDIDVDEDNLIMPRGGGPHK